MEDLTVDDPINVAGMGILLTGSNGKDFDPQELEQQIINGPHPKKKKTNLSDDFAKEMERLTRSVGFSDSKDFKDTAKPVAKAAPAPRKFVVPELNKPFELDDLTFDDAPVEAKSTDIGIDDLLAGDLSTPAAPAIPAAPAVDESVQDPHLQRMTREEKKQAVINDVFKDSGSQPMFSVEKEKEEDEKARKLEQISFLLETLEEEGEDLARIPKVSSKNSLDEIDSILKLLLLKNDRKRCCTFAEECILIGAHGMEWAFDGRKSYFGSKPDMTDWHKSVQTKLRRMRHDTSNVVQNIMTAYNLGSGTRIALELIPSMFLYSRMRKTQHKDNMVSDDEFNAGIDHMRNLEQKSDT